MKVDADTITSEQIRKVRDEGLRTIDVLNDCDMALAARRGEYGAGRAKADAALARCADAWNARYAKPTDDETDMLYRVALARHFTSSSTRPTYDRARVLSELEKRKLVRFDPETRWHLTDDGERALAENLDESRAKLLASVRERAAPKAD